MRGYWIPLTVLLVMRPETAHTYTRCFGRVAGICVGVVIASAVTLLWAPSGFAAGILAVLFLGITYAVSIVVHRGDGGIGGCDRAAPRHHGDASSSVSDLLFASSSGVRSLCSFTWWFPMTR